MILIILVLGKKQVQFLRTTAIKIPEHFSTLIDKSREFSIGINRLDLTGEQFELILDNVDETLQKVEEQLSVNKGKFLF